MRILVVHLLKKATIKVGGVLLGIELGLEVAIAVGVVEEVAIGAVEEAVVGVMEEAGVLFVCFIIL